MMQRDEFAARRAANNDLGPGGVLIAPGAHEVLAEHHFDRWLNCLTNFIRTQNGRADR